MIPWWPLGWEYLLGNVAGAIAMFLWLAIREKDKSKGKRDDSERASEADVRPI